MGRKIVIGITSILLLFFVGGCGIQVNQTDEATQIEKTAPEEKVFATKDKEYTLTADTQWKNVLEDYIKSNKDMTLMINKKMLFIGVILQKKNEYQGTDKIKNVKDYSEMIVAGMEKGTKTFESTEVMNTDVGQYEGYYADAEIEKDDMKLSYRMYFADTGKDYVEIIFWTDKSVFEDNIAAAEKIVETFNKN